MQNNQQPANHTPTEYFNHLVSNNLICVNRILSRLNNQEYSELTIYVNVANNQLFLMPNERHIKALQNYKIDEQQVEGNDISMVNLTEFLLHHFSRLGFFEDINELGVIHEDTIVYSCNDRRIQSIEDYRREALPHVRF